MNIAIDSFTPTARLVGAGDSRLLERGVERGVERSAERGAQQNVGADAFADRSQRLPPSAPDETASEPSRDGGATLRDGAPRRVSEANNRDLTRLSEEELALVRELAAIDREVRAHEQAHAAVGGPYAGSPSYTYTRGPDGRQYAVGGEVPIDVSPVAGNPEATINKARTVRRAALAPAQPSSQDRSVAARATAMEQQARAELLEQEAEAARSEAGQAPRGTSAAIVPEDDALTEFEEILSSYRPVDARA